MTRARPLAAVVIAGIVALLVGYGVARALDRPTGSPVEPIELEGPVTAPTPLPTVEPPATSPPLPTVPVPPPPPPAPPPGDDDDGDDENGDGDDDD